MQQFNIDLRGKTHIITRHDDGTFELPPELLELRGVGSALKPSWEPILLFRKPLEGTLADNVLEHGTGGINIAATRVRHASKADFEAHKAQVDAIKGKGGKRGKSWKNSSDLSGANEVKEGGRWPANCLLEHSPLCQKVGTQEIAPHPQGPDRFQKTSGGDFSDAYGNQRASDEPEVAPIWKCAEGCPVRELNEQSGERPSTLTGRADPNTSHRHPGHEMNPNSAFLGERTHLSRVYADGGGAARFFSQFEGEEPGQWDCVEGCPVKALDDQSGHLHARGNVTPEKADKDRFTWGRVNDETVANPGDEGGASRFFSQFDGVPFKYVPKANRKEAGCGEFEVQHITVKPLALMRWLVKLVTRKGGVVLDLYCGSGSTLHAAVLEGMQFIGMERDPTSHAEAVRRLEIVQRKEQERRDAEDLLDFALGRSEGSL